MGDLYGKCGTCGRVWLVAKAGILLTTAAKLSKRAACANGCDGKVFPATADEIAASAEGTDRIRFLRGRLAELRDADASRSAMFATECQDRAAAETELARLRALIAGLDPDHWGLQARVVALKEAAMKEGGA
jgi:hypothetical protein